MFDRAPGFAEVVDLVDLLVRKQRLERFGVNGRVVIRLDEVLDDDLPVPGRATGTATHPDVAIFSAKSLIRYYFDNRYFVHGYSTTFFPSRKL